MNETGRAVVRMIGVDVRATASNEGTAPTRDDLAQSSRAGWLAVFMLEQVMPGLTPADIDAVQRALADATRRVTLEGLTVRCLRASYVPSQHRWIVLFVSRRVDWVRRVAELAQLTYPRISEVMVLASRSPQAS